MDRTTLSATTVPVNTLPRTWGLNGWERLPFSYKGAPAYVNLTSGDWCYEADFERLVEIPAEVVEAICEVRLLDWAIAEATPEARLALVGGPH